MTAWSLAPKVITKFFAKSSMSLSAIVACLWVFLPLVSHSVSEKLLYLVESWLNWPLNSNLQYFLAVWNVFHSIVILAKSEQSKHLRIHLVSYVVGKHQSAFLLAPIHGHTITQPQACQSSFPSPDSSRHSDYLGFTFLKNLFPELLIGFFYVSM